MKKLLSLLILNMLFTIAYSQEENYFKFLEKFYKTDTIILAKSGIDVSDQKMYNDLIAILIKRDDVTIIAKGENQLNSNDLRKHIIFFGVAKNYLKLNEYSPEALKKTQTGFDFGPYIFNDPLDVVYLYSSDTTRLFFVGNSVAALESVFSTYTALLQYQIMQKFTNTHYGTLEMDRFVKSLDVDMVNERKNSMFYTRTKFYNFYYSKKFGKEYMSNDLMSQIDSKVDNIIKILELKEPDHKIDCFLYYDKNEKIRLSHSFGEGNAMIKAWENHCTDLSSLEHETVHILFNNQIITKDNWIFLGEGITEYYFTTKDDYWNRLKYEIKNKENIPIDEYLTNRQKFWNGSDLSYPLSGHFCRFLIDKYGLDSFKQLFISGLDNGLEKVYGIGKAQIIKDWKEFVIKN
jgi:hypothetical protein